MTVSSRDQAEAILRGNDLGSYTVPTKGLYPYLWNWDSVFAALGFAAFDRDRAWRELETLFEGQWDTGMVPHIIFWQVSPDYFPGPDVWQGGVNPDSSGISQPPVAATAVRWLLDSGDAEDRARAEALYPKLFAYHRWYHEARDPDRTGVIAVMHPWETGRDNCPDWDMGLNRVPVPDDLGSYQRRDLGHVDASERPTMDQYDRYLSLVKFGRDCRWDQEHLYRSNPFLMADPGIQFILLRADRDLRALARHWGSAEQIAQLDGWIRLGETGADTLWNPAANGYCAKDLRTGKMSDAVTNASMLAFYADTGSAHQRAGLLSTARRILSQVQYGFPSWDPAHDGFEAQRYWRGPVWSIMNRMIAAGLAEQGERGMAERLRADTAALVENHGFYEYFNPLTGQGCGGRDFTWTAAVHLEWALNDGREEG